MGFVKKSGTILTFLVVLALAAIVPRMMAGPSLEIQLQEYFAEADASQARMKAVAAEMQTSMDGLRKEVASGEFDLAEIKSRLSVFADRMANEKQALSHLTVPEEAEAHRGILAREYEVALAVLEKMGPMLDVAKQMTGVAAKSKDTKDQKALTAGMEEMKSLQKEIMVHQKEVIELAKVGKRLSEEAKDERARLTELYPSIPPPPAD